MGTIQSGDEFAAVRNAVADVLGVWPAAMTSRERRGLAVFARQAAMFAARELTGAGYDTIARAFGRKDHASACAAHRAMQARTNDPQLAKAMKAARRALDGYRARRASDALRGEHETLMRVIGAQVVDWQRLLRSLDTAIRAMAALEGALRTPQATQQSATPLRRVA